MNETIVVGIDGSGPARLAVRWAAREAGLRHADLVLVSAWNLPLDGYNFGDVPFTEEALKALEIEAEERLAEAAEEARSVSTDLWIMTHAIQGQAAGVLLHASRDADLLVIGSRGLGGFRGLLLGSVSQQCVDHASCPVVVVRHLHEGSRR
jgi:nucleotide-binding universal stress UspA family protein